MDCTTQNGGVPGLNTPNEKAPQAANLEGLKTTSNGTQIIALCGKLRAVLLDSDAGAYLLISLSAVNAFAAGKALL